MRSTLLLASFLAIVPFVSASPSPSLAARKSAPTIVEGVDVFNGHFTFRGCITDSEDKRVLAGDFTAPNGNTPNSCMNLCNDLGFIRGGVENSGASCFCGNEADNPFQNVALTDCQLPCFVDSSSACGAFNLMVYYTKDGT